MDSMCKKLEVVCSSGECLAGIFFHKLGPLMSFKKAWKKSKSFNWVSEVSPTLGCSIKISRDM